MAGETQQLLSLSDVATHLGVHYETVRTWIHTGKLQGRRLAGRRTIQVLKSDLASFIAAAQCGPTGGPIHSTKATGNHVAPLAQGRKVKNAQPHAWRRDFAK